MKYSHVSSKQASDVRTVNGPGDGYQARAEPAMIVLEALQRLDYLREVGQATPQASPAYTGWGLPWTSEECYAFLAALGLVWRSRLGPLLDAAIEGTISTHSDEMRLEPPWQELGREFGEVMAWAAKTYRQHGASLAAYAVHVPQPDAWLRWVEELREASEFADPALTLEEMEEIAANVTDALRQLDEAELVCALSQIQAEKLGTSQDRISTDSRADLITHLPNLLEVFQRGLDECGAWLDANSEMFSLATPYVQAVLAGLRDDLENLPDLQITAWKYQTLQETCCVAAIAPTIEACESLQQAIRRAVQTAKSSAASALNLQEPYAEAKSFPTARLSTFETGRLPTLVAYPRDMLCPMLAAASEQGQRPRLLRWKSPDRRYEAALVIQGNRATLSFYDPDGNRAQELAGVQVYIAGVSAVTDKQARAVFDLQQLYNTGKPVSLEVGKQRQVWIPAEGSESPALSPAS